MERQDNYYLKDVFKQPKFFFMGNGMTGSIKIKITWSLADFFETKKYIVPNIILHIHM